MLGEWSRSRAPFVELRRQVEVTRKRRRSAGGGLSMLNGFKAKEEEGEIGRHQFGGGIEGHEMPAWFVCLCTKESCRWRCMARQKLGRPRRQKSPGWAGLGQDGPEDLADFGGNERKLKWAERKEWAENRA
jgi:hypothetical protein